MCAAQAYNFFPDEVCRCEDERLGSESQTSLSGKRKSFILRSHSRNTYVKKVSFCSHSVRGGGQNRLYEIYNAANGLISRIYTIAALH